MSSNTAKQRKSTQARKTVAFIVYPQIKLLDLSGPLQVFSDAKNAEGKSAYSAVVVSSSGSSVCTDTCVSISSEPASDWFRRKIDTTIIVGGNGVFKAIEDANLLSQVTRLAGRSRRVGSICTGAFILAECGLLNGLRAVTHWGSCERLAVNYPSVTVESNPIYVKDNDTWSSAGVTAGLDMALAMISEDLGRQAALTLARSLVTYLIRPGSQSQFSEALNVQVSDNVGRFDMLHEWVHSNLKKDLSVERLALHSRLYLQETGRTPAKAVEAMRVELARRMLEGKSRRIGQIAQQTGFKDLENMRRAFIRLLKISPQDYRNRFQK